ncbi:ArsR family transcriptional regulator [Frondihabitans sp. PhB188]|uniref:ArsR/SmtB family transcription factor n=1 Tax=Frondihabitans sp. PhB188 TaxID=2485200 RepID=UPI000F4820DC|nr:metalloregulator ArsR/SmtB family transcription factor [Frondihabitans sp. PhB188]ROQ39737.1 ArsR family transcriptional regulator [Frondihabitans sp. PhB188]
MVVEKLTQDEIDRIFHALADATRRDIVQRVIRAEQSVSTLADRYEMSFAAVQKHVAVLERASLVHKARRGREQIVSGDIGTIQRAEQLLRSYEDIWKQRFRRMNALLAEDGPATDLPAPASSTDAPSKGTDT